MITITELKETPLLREDDEIIKFLHCDDAECIRRYIKFTDLLFMGKK